MDSFATPSDRMVAIILPGKWEKGKGHEVFFVIEGEKGYRKTGDAQSMKEPWYWGDPDDESKSYEKAFSATKEYNSKRGITPEEAEVIIISSMNETIRRQGLVREERESLEASLPQCVGILPYKDIHLIWDYVIEGKSPGKFLEAVLANEFHEAVTSAEKYLTIDQFKALSQYVHGSLPDECWRSRKNVNAWKKAGGKIGLGWLERK